MLEVSHLSAGYGGKIVLVDVSLTVKPGTVLALIGPNGSGKTTFIRAASGVIPIESGSILVEGKEIHKMTSQERARALAVVPQVRTLPPAFTADEVVALGRTPHLNWFGKMTETDLAIVAKALAQTSLTELAERTVSELSGGEQQRLLLARALAQEAGLLLMDEPTTHLDLQYQVNLLQRINRLAHPGVNELNEGIHPRAVVIAIHDLNLISRYADQVALLVDGRLIRCGTPEEVLQVDLLSEAYQLPLHVIHNGEAGLSIIMPASSPNSL